MPDWNAGCSWINIPGWIWFPSDPTIKGAHSPDEGIEIESAEKFWKLLIETLKRIPEA